MFFRSETAESKPSSFSAASLARISSSNRLVTITASEMEKMMASLWLFSAAAMRDWICNLRFSEPSCSIFAFVFVSSALRGRAIWPRSSQFSAITKPISPVRLMCSSCMAIFRIERSTLRQNTTKTTAVRAATSPSTI